VPRNPDPATYALVYEEAREYLSRQESSLDEIRSRTGTLIAAAALAASFVGTATAPHGFGWTAILGFGAFVASAVLCLYVLLPVKGWVFGNDTTSLITDFVEGDNPMSLTEIHRELAIHHAGHITRNEGLLQHLYWAFRGAAVLLIAEVILLLLSLRTP
jgi:hypothetical protein